MSVSRLTVAEAFALQAEVVAEQSAEDKVLFWGELVERSGDDAADSLDALRSSEEDVSVVETDVLHTEIDVELSELIDGGVHAVPFHSKEDEVSDAFLVFVDMVAENHSSTVGHSLVKVKKLEIERFEPGVDTFVSLVTLVHLVDREAEELVAVEGG